MPEPPDHIAQTSPGKLKALRIGSISVDPPLILAPMAGITDRPFRALCRQLGAGLAVSEMLSSDPSLRDSRKSRERAEHAGEPGPISVQIAGADPARMAAAARWNVEHGAQIIDINMGCPAKKVCKAAAGSALLRDEALVGRILEAVVASVDVPVTLKTRTGWSPETRNLSRIAHLARESGIAMLAVHGRTRACGYAGEAELDSLRALRAQTDLPLAANGDIDSPEAAKRVLDTTGADAIMIGRAARGRPWIFREVSHYLATDERLPEPGSDWILDLLTRHLDALYTFYGERRGVRIARKHVGWYCRNSKIGSIDPPAAGQLLELINGADKARQQIDAINNYFNKLQVTEAAA